MDHAVTATQKTILAAFGMDDKTIRKKANELAEMLKRLLQSQKQDMMQRLKS